MLWLELETVVGGGLCELNLCSVSEWPSHLALFGQCWISLGTNHMERQWCEPRGAGSRPSMLKLNRAHL